MSLTYFSLGLKLSKNIEQDTESEPQYEVIRPKLATYSASLLQFVLQLCLQRHRQYCSKRTCFKVGGGGLTAPHHKGTYSSVWFFFIVASDCNFSDDDECFSEELQDSLPPAVTYLLLQNGFTVGVITLQRPCSVIHTFPVSAPCKKRENGNALAISQTYCFKMHVEL